MSPSLKRILIVDDDEDILANFADILNDLGFQTETARNGEAALELAEANRPDPLTSLEATGERFDLCLVDFLMPGMNGTELMNRLHRVDPGLPVIMVTAHVGSESFELPPATDRQHVLRKPVDVKQLVAMIEQLIQP